MEVVKIDVLDGKGVIQVAVGNYLDSFRLREFIADAYRLAEKVAILEEGMAAVEKELKS